MEMFLQIDFFWIIPLILIPRWSQTVFYAILFKYQVFAYSITLDVSVFGEESFLSWADSILAKLNCVDMSVALSDGGVKKGTNGKVLQWENKTIKHLERDDDIGGEERDESVFFVRQGKTKGFTSFRKFTIIGNDEER